MIMNEFSFVDLFKLAQGAQEKYKDASDKYDKGYKYVMSKGDPSKNYSMSSSAKAASKLIAVFPLLCSSNISKDTASLLTKYTERRGCVQLQLALTAVNLQDAETGFEYLRNFHQNISGGGTLADYERMLANVVSNESAEMDMSTMNAQYFVESLKTLYSSGYYESDINHLSLNDYMVTESCDGYTVSVDPYKEYFTEATGKGTEKSGTLTDMKDSDVKKTNESVPSLMVVRFTNKDTKIVTEFLIGVKAKLIPADYTEILNKIVKKNRDGKGLINLIRATTGEINIFTDYLLAIDSQKEDILARSKKGSNEDFWKTLENSAIKAERMLRQNKVNYASAITTVAITSEDAEYLYKNENVDIRNVKEVKNFMQAYNIMGFIIVNDVEEVAWMIYDEEEPYYEKISYTMLERENNDGQYKKIVNLISKMK